MSVTSSQLKNTINNLADTTLKFAAEAILSLPLALVVVMVAGLLLFAPDVLKGVPATWTQTLAQLHAAILHVAFGTVVHTLAAMLRAVFLCAWLVALFARLVIRYLPDPANYAVDKANSGCDTGERADASCKAQTGNVPESC
ncbi:MULTISPECIES: hypothetical protein [Acidithiobacillus]|uniref:hypothetical protein n=1 Tax=Acidithiobacillus ferrivorans TaxID=160808 RepID=UPI001C07963D|nr:hypothetical protein [Acidithiobacillus ferrivorans]MBU2851165.1 hypothetical protein [Acidithiobacillus ferrivorans]